jgi:hypothetical protein
MEDGNLHPMFRASQEAINNEEVRKAAQVLAKHNLGVCIPHMHDEETREISPLPSGIVACERDLKVSFEEVTDTVQLTPVAWRWNGTDLEVCSSCCGMAPN